MDFQASLEQLETVAQIIMAPPNVVSKEQRANAENVLLSFRKTRQALGICKYILQHSQTELVVFQTAEVLRENLIQEWNLISPDEIQQLHNDLVSLLFKAVNFTYSVQRRIGAVIALIVKHQSLTSPAGKQRSELVAHLENVVLTSPGHPLIVAVSILDALLSEHQFVAHATDASLTYEMHFAAKKDFENIDLLRIFKFCLRYITTSYSEHTQQNKRDLDLIVKLLEMIMYWNFSKNYLPKRIYGILELDSTPTFRPPTAWNDIISDSGFVPAFFALHMKVRRDEDFVLRTVNLMVQLVSIQGPMICSKYARAEFLSRVLPPFTRLLELNDKLPVEVFGLSDVVRKILLFNRAMILSSVPVNVLELFLKAVGQFSCFVIQQSVIEESRCNVDDRVYRDSMTRVLEAWMNLLTDTDTAPKELIQPIVTNIFDNYLGAHISPPEGFRQVTGISSDDIQDDDDDVDTTTFREQLQPAGIFGRYILTHSVPIITHLLTFKSSALQSQIQVVANGGASRDSLTLLYEDLHWLILIAGHILAFDGLGETNLIPAEINDFSIASNTNPALAVTAVENAFKLLPPPDFSSVDPIVRLVCCVISLSSMEKRVIDNGLSDLLSPELASNVMWFLHRFCQSYFCINEDYYTCVSPSYLTSWGVGSSTAVLTQTSLFLRIREDLIRFNGEPDVMKESINLLLSLVDSNKKAESAIRSPELGPLVQLINQVGPGQYQMPNDMYRTFVRAIVAVGSFCEDESTRESYWDQVLGPLTARLARLVNLRPSERHRDDVRLELACVLSGFIGTAMSAHSRIASALYRKIGAVVAQCGGILDAYHNYVDIVELCLELVIELAKRSLSYLGHADSLGIYEAAMGVLKSYALHARGRVTTEKTAEEDAYHDLVLLMDMLNCLLTKDFLDLSPDALSDSGVDPTTAVTASDVSLQGLSIVLPLMNADLLQYPSLSLKYYRLIAFLSELHADKVMALPHEMLQALYQSVQIGLQGSVQDSFGSCCDFISHMAAFIGKQSQQSTSSAEFCKPFVKIFLEMVLSQKLGKDSIPVVSSALFALISAFSDIYGDLANQLIASRSDEQIKQTLSEAFTHLVENLNLTAGGDRQSRAAFRERLDNFIFAARGCLE